MKRLRLPLLLAILGFAIIYAIVTDRPAPAWGESRRPGLAIVVLAGSLLGALVWTICRLLIDTKDAGRHPE